MKTITTEIETSVAAAERVRDQLLDIERLYYEQGAGDASVSVFLRRLHGLLDEQLNLHEWEEQREIREARLAARPTIAEKWDE